MARLLRVAEVAAGAEEAVLHEWGVAEQASFSTGDVIATLETEKAVVDVEAESDGVLVARLVPEGTAVAVGGPIALLASPGEQLSDVAAELERLGYATNRAPSKTAPSETTSSETAPAASPTAAGVPDHPERLFSSPLARRMARDAGIAVEDLVGTGPGGRIVKRDVLAAQDRQDAGASSSSSPVSGDRATITPRPPAHDAGAVVTDVPHSAVRRAVAARLTASKQSAPHFYLRAGVEVDELVALRRQLVEAGVPVSLNDLVVRAVALAHRRVPEMNVTWMPDAVRHHTSVDVAIAVTTDRGLVTPVLRGVESTPIGALAEESRRLVDRARRGDLRQHELEGGTITVSNLGMFDVEEFTAIINPPQSAILAVGAAREQPVAHDGVLSVRTVMRLVLAVDHRPLDGAIAAAWLRELVTLLERPVLLLV